MTPNALLSIFFSLLLAACASQPKAPVADSTQPPDSAVELPGQGAPYAGVWLDEAEQGGAMVLGVIAGPAAIAGLMTGDRILRIEDVEVDATRAKHFIETSLPGTRLRLQVVRGTTPMEIELVIDKLDRWLTPAAFAAAIPYSATGLADTDESPDFAIGQALSLAPDAAPISERLDRMFAQLARNDAGYHKLPLIRQALMRPGTMTNWREKLVRQLRPTGNDRSRAVEVMCETLALACPAQLVSVRDGPTTLGEFAAAIAAANRQVRDVFAKANVDRAQATRDLQYLMENIAADRTLLRQPDVVRGIRAMQLSMQVDLAALLTVADRLLTNAQRLPDAATNSRQPPDALREFVQGEILDYSEVDGGYVVIGGSGANAYQMDQLYAVIDIGGDDLYRWRNGVPRETQTVIDLAGNDRYEASRGGPGAGWLGVSVLIDRAGDDRYESALGGCGAGALGFGLLFDDGGTDFYQCAAWSVGTGLYGGGLLIDSGVQTDVYLSQVFSQGVGGPRGIGLLIDAGGADVYRANGPVASAYGTPGSFMAFSQGVGVGIRPYDYGGVGVLLDFGGDDRYEGGEFSQGGGYLWGVGLLFDATGNDLYYGNRYSQGFAAHQAFGMLADMAGDDVYWSMTAAGQGAAWDQSIAVLFEGGGNDVYRAQGLSQGAAAQQARALLHDVAGDDVYWASTTLAQGVAGDNNYHFSVDDPIYSLGMLLDETGTDRYSTRLGNGEVRLRRKAENMEQGKGIAGLAVDRE